MRSFLERRFSGVSLDKAFFASLITLAMPMVLQNLVNNSLAMLDTFMVGRLGEEALSGVSLANTVFFVLTLFNIGLQSGSSVLISQYWGKRDSVTISRIVGIGVALAMASSAIVVAAIAVSPLGVYSITSDDAALVSVAARYASIAAPSVLINNLTMMYISTQRAMGNTRLGLFVLVSSMSVNTFLNWVLIFGNLGFPALGVEGAAIATLIARVVELAITAFYALRVSDFRLDVRALLRPGMAIFRDFLRYAAPVVLNETLWGVGFSLYAVIIGHMPNAVAGVAAYTITLTAERLLSAAYFGVGNAAAVLVGVPLGAGNVKEARTVGATMAFVTTSFGVVTGAVMLAASLTIVPDAVFPLFGAKPETIAIGRGMLVMMSLVTPFRAFNFVVIVGLLRGGGDVRAGAFIDIFGVYCIALPSALLAGFVFHASVSVVYLCISLEEVVKVALAFVRYRQRKWLRNVTRDMPAHGAVQRLPERRGGE